MAEFNPQELQTYYDIRNYAGAADYLENHLPANKEGIIAVRSHIKQLRKDAAMQQMMLSTANLDQQQAFNFINAINGSGVIPRNRTYTLNGQQMTEQNDFGQTYNDNINSLQSKNGGKLNRIGIDISNDEDFRAIQSILDVQDWNNNSLGITHSALQKGHRLYIDVTNKNLYKLINAGNAIRNKSAWNIVNNISARTAEGGVLGGGAGSFIGGVGAIPGALIGGGVGLVTGIGEEIYGAFDRDSRIKIIGIESNGTVWYSNDFNIDNRNKAIDTVNKANELYTELMTSKEKEQTITSEVYATQFLGAGDAEAYKAMQQGRIDMEDYNRIHKMWQESYNRLVSNHDFNSTAVYSWRADSKEGQVLKQVSPEDITNLKGELLVAMNDGRAEMSLAIKDGKIGTMFNITPKKKGEKGNGDEWSEDKGEVQTSIFVEDLFEGTAEQMFANDTKMSATRDNAEMKRWHYKQTLSSGTTVGYDNNGNPYVESIDANSNTVINNITEDKMLKYLNEDAIINGVVTNVLVNTGNDGNLYKLNKNGQLEQQDLDSTLMVAATAAAAELYEYNSDIEKVAYQNELYQKLRNILSGYRKQDNKD